MTRHTSFFFPYSIANEIDHIAMDVNGANVQVSAERLYSLVFGQDYGEHILEIDVDGKGFKLYTFTFG